MLTRANPEWQCRVVLRIRSIIIDLQLSQDLRGLNQLTEITHYESSLRPTSYPLILMVDGRVAQTLAPTRVGAEQ